jgi:hypothetical protein
MLGVDTLAIENSADVLPLDDPTILRWQEQGSNLRFRLRASRWDRTNDLPHVKGLLYR